MKIYCFQVQFNPGCTYVGIVWGENLKKARASVNHQYRAYAADCTIKVWLPKLNPLVPVDPIACY